MRTLSDARSRRRALGAVLLALAVLAAPSAALAHGILRRSAPADGARLSAAPRELRLAFGGKVAPGVARVELTGPDSAAVELGPLAAAPDSANVLVVPIRGALVPGEYRVAYQVPGADGHPVRGRFAFVIAPGASGLAPPPGADVIGPVPPGQALLPAEELPTESMEDDAEFGVGSPMYVAVRWLGFAAVLVVVGAAAFRWAVLPRVHPGGADAAILRGAAEAGAARLGLTAAGVLAIATVLRLLAQSSALNGSADALDPALVGAMVTHTLWGWAWLLQAGAVVLAVVGFRFALRGSKGGVTAASAPAPSPDAVAEPPSDDIRPPRHEHRPDRARTGWVLAAVAAVALALAAALSGHAAAATRLAPLPVLADALHVLSAGAWLGCLLVLLAAGLPAAGGAGEGRARGMATLVEAFSPVALVSAGVLSATGVFTAAVHLESVAALWQSVYGRTLLVKLALLTLVFATGAYNWKRVRPALGQEAAVARLRRSAGAELAVGIAVLLVTAVLVATSPPGGG